MDHDSSKTVFAAFGIKHRRYFIPQAVNAV